MSYSIRILSYQWESVCVYLCACVCVYACVRGRKRETKARVTRPALPPGCLAPNSHQPAGPETENLLALATVSPHRQTHK